MSSGVRSGEGQDLRESPILFTVRMNRDSSTVREWDRLVARTPGSDLDEPAPAPATAASSSRRFHVTPIA
jgi:hypothetical protein